VTEVRVVKAEAFGAACLAALLEAVGSRPNPVVGLPTGNTPVALFEALRAAVEDRTVDISAWQPFAIDEYGGPRDHPCSNCSFFARYWDAIPGAPAVEQFDPEARDVTAECHRMSKALARAGGLTVAVLGIGLNGHLAFNEPGSAGNSLARRMELHPASLASGSECWGNETPAWGLTLGLAELLSADTVLGLANGAAKASIVAAALEGAETEDVPASLTRRARHTIWVLDEAAASGLGG
jgi:glucosamine-6-phosphate deaminase